MSVNYINIKLDTVTVCGTAGIHNTSKTGSCLQVNAILYTLYRESSFITALKSGVLL
jgi:hypothetical protein